MRSAVHLLE